LHRPVVVIPQVLLDGPPDDWRNVLIHELAHLRGNHPLQLFVEHIVQLVCWFHPAVWQASNRASLVREYVCDDAVLEAGVQCSTYLKTLLNVAEFAEIAKKPLAISFGKKTTELILRAQRLVEMAAGLNPINGRQFLSRRAAATSLVLIAMGLAQVGIPTDPSASSRSEWSSWPTWSARCLHCFGVTVRDYDVFDRRTRAFEQLHEDGAYESVPAQPSRAI
jgi:beta-lactamase regulating signal transducer with metallopeptidase domain